MGILIDILLIAVVIAVVYFSAKKGLVITVLEIAAFILAIFLAAQTALPVASATYTAFFETTVQKKLYDTITDTPTGITYVQKAQYTLESIPDFAKDYAQSAGISVDTITEKIAASNYANDGKLYVTIEKEIVKPIAVSVLKSIWFFILSILYALILRVIAKSINKFIKKSKLLGPANAILGGGFGVIKGFVVVFLICCMLTYVQPQIESETIHQGISDSFFVQKSVGLDPLETLSSAILLGK